MLQQLKNTYYLYRVNKNPSMLKEGLQQALRIIWWAKGFKKHHRNRNLIASIIRQLRVKEPYKLGRYDEAKDGYYNYFKMDSAILSFELIEKDVFVVKYTNDFYYKDGFKYYKGSEFSYIKEKVFRVNKKLNLEDFTGYFGDAHISNMNLTSFRYATMEEITEFYKRKVEYKKLQREEKVLRKKLSELENLKAEV